MSRTRRSARGVVALWLGGVALQAHEEWNNLHIVYSAKSSFTYPFDGRSPKIAAALLNHYEIPAPATNFTFSVNGQRMDSKAFGTFPDGGSIVVAPEEYGLASAIVSGIYDGRAGPAPAVGDTKEYTFQFVFALAPGAVAPPGSSISTNPDPSNNNDIPGITTAAVRFTNLGDNPALTGPLPLNGTVRLNSAPTGSTAAPVNPRVEVATPYSNWFPVGVTSTAAFSQTLPARDDWLVRFSADNLETRIVPYGFINDPHPPMNIALAAVAPPQLDYRRAVALATPTGFWRGAVSETDGTFVVFPGQENWKAAAADADARSLRAAARIGKYKFDGTRVWEHAPGWETWGGDMTPDGRFVAYVLNPTVLPFYTPTENKLVLLDGATGVVLWTKAAAPNDPAVGRRLDSLEVAFSPDTRWIAVGSVGTGVITLMDRATGNFVWSTPGTGTPSFGQVRKLRFSPDSQFLYCGSGDSTLRKLRVTDGVVLWRILAGGWPYVNGLDLTSDGAWLVAGTKSLDATMVRTSDGFLQWQRETQFVDAVFSPDGRHAVTFGGQIYRTLDGSLAGMTKAAGLARFTPDSRYVLQLERELRLYDLGGKPLKTFEASGIGSTSGEAPQWSYVTRDGRYVIALGRDMPNPPQTGIVIYERRVATGNPPSISAPPLAQAVTTGGTATFALTARSTGSLSYQWRKNGIDLLGASGSAGSILVIPNASATDAGTYTCVVTDAAGSTSSTAAALTVVGPDPTNPGRLTNLAVRANVGAVPLIVGFSVGGAGTTGTKTLLIRGAGPSLGALGVTGPLADPRLALFDGPTEVASNNNWAGEPQVTALATQLGAFPFSGPTSRDAALAATAVGGSYTAQLASVDATSGTALAEIYDGSTAFTATTPRLVNVSARTDVGGANLLIAGFVVTGSAARTVLIRGIGPALASFGINSALGDPRLTLFRDGVLVAENDNWHDAANAVALASASVRVGAFALSPSSRDAALMLSLPPGSYTAQVGDATGSGASGNALVEVYEVP